MEKQKWSTDTIHLTSSFLRSEKSQRGGKIRGSAFEVTVNHLIKFGCPVVSLLAHLIDYSTMLCEYVTIKHWPKMCVIVLKKKTPKRKLGACDSIFLWKEERKDQWEGDCAYWPDRKANLWK